MSEAVKFTYKESDSNVARIIEYVNSILADDAHTKDVIPAPTDKEGYAKACANATILGKLLLKADSKAFDVQKLNACAKGGFQVNANQLLLIDGLKDAGFKGYEGLKPESFGDPNPDLVLELTEKFLRKILLDNFVAKNFPDLVTVGPMTTKAKDEKKEEKKEEGPMARVKIVKKTGPPAEELIVRFVNQQLRVQKNFKILTSLSQMTPDIWVQFTKGVDPVKCPTDVSTLKAREEMAAVAVDNLKALGCCAFITPKEILDVNTDMFIWHFSVALPKYKLFNPIYEETGRALANFGTEKDQRIKLWMEPTGKMKVDGKAVDVLKDHISIFYLIEEVMPVDWTKVNKGKLNNFKAQDNWKLAMSQVFTLTRFPPQMEAMQLCNGEEDKIDVLVNMLYDAWREKVCAKLNEAELLAWANPLAACKAGAVSDLKEAGPAYLASVLLSLDPKSDMFFDASKVDDSLDCAKEVYAKCAKFGIHLNVCPSQIAAKDKKAVMMALSEIKAVLSLAQ